MKAYLYTPDGDGKSRELRSRRICPKRQTGHEELVELVAEGKDEAHGGVFEKRHLCPRSILWRG